MQISPSFNPLMPIAITDNELIIQLYPETILIRSYKDLCRVGLSDLSCRRFYEVQSGLIHDELLNCFTWRYIDCRIEK
jgi:hypothetical protein